MRKVLAMALLCLTLLFCGLDSSGIGDPAEPETALHAMVHGHDAGARGAVVQLTCAAFVALATLLPLVGRNDRPSSSRRFVVRSLGHPSDGWRTALATRGPPALG